MRLDSTGRSRDGPLCRLAGEQPLLFKSTGKYQPLRPGRVRDVCLFCEQEEISMARKVGQIIARGDRRWLVRVYLGCDRETKKRK